MLGADGRQSGVSSCCPVDRLVQIIGIVPIVIGISIVGEEFQPEATAVTLRKYLTLTAEKLWLIVEAGRSGTLNFIM